MSAGTRARAGFTLIEIVVVILIMTIAAAAVAPALPPLDGGSPDAADTLVRLLRKARVTSARRAARVIVTVDPESGRYWVEAVRDRERELLERGRLPLGPDARISSAEPRVRFRFLPLGTAFGGPLRLRGDGGVMTIFLEPWTGEPGVRRQ